MTRIKQSITTLGSAAALTAAVLFGNAIYKDAQFASAQQEVKEAREGLQNANDLSAAFRAVGKTVEPSVVNIDVISTVRGVSRPTLEQLKDLLPDNDGDGEPDLPPGLRNRQNQPAPQVKGEGSGVIVDFKDGVGYIVTNNHVAGNAESITITLADGRKFTDVRVVGTDPNTDLAVLEVKADHLIPAKFGSSNTLEKGDIVIAFGSPFGLVGSMTQGIVSALDRRSGILGQYGYEHFIQTDCAINPGNSGGPLVNLRGEIIGINTAIASNTGSFNGIGFAIPSDQVQRIYKTLRSDGKVTRGYLGVKIATLSDEPQIAEQLGYTKGGGVYVDATYRNTPAYDILEPGDIITAIDGQAVASSDALRNRVAEYAPDTKIKLDVFREGKETSVEIKLGAQPTSIDQVAQGKRAAPKEAAPAPKIGLQLRDLTPELAKEAGVPEDTKGAVVTAVAPNSPAASWGIPTGTIITRIDGKPVTTAAEAVEALRKSDLKKGLRLNTVTEEGRSTYNFRETN